MTDKCDRCNARFIQGGELSKPFGFSQIKCIDLGHISLMQKLITVYSASPNCCTAERCDELGQYTSSFDTLLMDDE